MLKLLALVLGLTSMDPASSLPAQDPQAGPKQAGDGAGEKEPVDLDRIREAWNVEASGPITLLLKSPAVREEIGLEPDQVKEIQDLNGIRMQELNDAIRQSYRVGQEGSDRLDTEIFTPRVEILNREMDGKLGKILEPEQYERLLEITLQIAGPLAVVRPEIQRRLKVPPPQAALIRDVYQRYVEAVEPCKKHRHSVFTALRQAEDPDEYRSLRKQLARSDEDLKRLRAEAARAIAKLLSRRQKDRFNEMLGEPFDRMADLAPPDLPPDLLQTQDGGRQAPGRR